MKQYEDLQIEIVFLENKDCITESSNNENLLPSVSPFGNTFEKK